MEIWKCRDRELDMGSGPLIMGILNVTPDSFSDGCRFRDPDSAVRHGLELVEAGAAIVDVGGESTRPGSRRVPVDEEMRRVLPVIRGLAAQSDCVISVDTMKSEVARSALDAGADIVNDISAGRWDPEMLGVVSALGAGMVLMHMQGEPQTMQRNPEYRDVVTEVRDFLAARLEACVEAGISKESVAVDPGIGFGKNLEHNLELLAGVLRLKELGRPVVIGASRKSFIGLVTGKAVGERLAGSLAVAAYCTLRGVDILRVHDVPETRDVVRLIQELRKREETR